MRVRPEVGREEPDTPDAACEVDVELGVDAQALLGLLPHVGQRIQQLQPACRALLLQAHVGLHQVDRLRIGVERFHVFLENPLVDLIVGGEQDEEDRRAVQRELPFDVLADVRRHLPARRLGMALDKKIWDALERRQPHLRQPYAHRFLEEDVQVRACLEGVVDRIEECVDDLAAAAIARPAQPVSRRIGARRIGVDSIRYDVIRDEQEHDAQIIGTPRQGSPGLQQILVWIPAAHGRKPSALGQVSAPSTHACLRIAARGDAQRLDDEPQS
jgi:hypothetical protein